MNKILLALLVCFTTFGLRLSAQVFQECHAGANIAPTCKTSCINCDLEGIIGKLPNGPAPMGVPADYCLGALVVNNPSYIGFVAGSADLTLKITTQNCTGTDGLEFAILEFCNDVKACSPGPSPQIAPGQFIFAASGLVPGTFYQLLIDGFNGDVCEYKIEVIGGSAAAPPLGPVTEITGPNQICPNAVVNFSIEPVFGAVSYYWEAPVGTSINGGLNTGFFPAVFNNNEIEVAFQGNGGNVCVTVHNACDPLPVKKCITVANNPLPITQLPHQNLCYGDIPYTWEHEPHPTIGAPGTYTFTSDPYTSYLGCDSIVRQTFTVAQPKIKQLPLKYLCKNECFEINGSTYCETGSFQENITTDQGCDSLILFSLFKVPAKAVAAVPDTLTCAITSVLLNGAGSTSGNTVTYQWLNPAGQIISSAITASATTTGVYSFIVTNNLGGGCKDTVLVVVKGDFAAPAVNAGPDKVLTCASTQVQLDGTGSTGSNYSYFWKAQLGGNIVSGATTLTPIVNAAGTYTLRVTNNLNGCTAISNVVVTSQIVSPTVVVSGGTISCDVQNITLQLSTNAPSPSFSWTGPGGFVSAEQNPTVSVAGNYVVVVTNGLTGCTATAVAVVNPSAGTPDVTATGGAITCTESSVTLGATSAVPDVTYAWTGPGSFTSSLQNPVVSVSGTYQVVVTAPNGCTNSATAAVVVNNNVPGTTLAVSGNLNCNNAIVNVLATSTGTNLVHDWTLPDGSTQSTGAVAFLPASVSGVYSVVVTNSTTGCSSTAAFTVIQHASVSASIDSVENTSCFDAHDGTLGVLAGGGNGTFTYLWSNTSTAPVTSDLGPGVYVVTVTDGEGCTATVSGSITAPTAVNANATATNQISNGSADGTATANPSGGTPGYTYEWSTSETTQSISGLLPGSYTVTVTDDNGCTSVKTVNVSQFDCALQTELSTTNVSCAGAGNGTASLEFLGGTSPFTVSWSTLESGNSIGSLAAGNYSVSITDAANCPEVQTFTITEPLPLVANASGSTATGVANGTASANPTGGTGTYTYLWSNDETTASIGGLTAGSYTVTVTDENGCTAAQTIQVLEGNCNLTTDLQLTNPSCNGGENGSATVVVTGGGGGFNYNWSSGGTSSTENGLGAGTYSVSVSDVNGCSITVAVELSEPSAISLNIESNVPTTCPTASEGSLTISATGGTGVLSVVWSDNQTGLTASGLAAGTYTAVVTDENTCSATVSATVVSSDTEAPVITASNSIVPIGPDGTVVLTVQNITNTITDNCSLATVSFEPASFNCVQRGDHQVTITATDNAGLSSTQTITVTIVDDEVPVLVCSPSLVLCYENNVVSYQAPTASDNCFGGGVFHIIEGLAIGATFPVGSTITTYTYTDSTGNVGSCSFEVTILTQLEITVDTVINDVNFQSVGAAFVNVAGSLSPYSYSWTLNGQVISTQQNITGLAPGEYTLVVTDDNGCTSSTQVTVTNTSATKNPVVLDAIRIFPNPTSGNISIVLPDDLVGHDVFMQVFDMTGRRVMEQNSLQDKQIEMALLDLADGVYSLVVRIDNNQIVRKIVLNK